MSEHARILWQGAFDEPRRSDVTSDRSILERLYRILLVPGSSRLWVEELVPDRLGVDAWRDVDGTRAVMALETALCALDQGYVVPGRSRIAAAPLAVPDEPRAPKPVQPPSAPTAPIDDTLPFKTGEFAGKRLSELDGLLLKKLANGFLRAAKEAQSETARNDKLSWLHQLQLWAAFRGVNKGPDGVVWPNWPEPPGETG